MWSVFAIKCLMYHFVKPLLTISLGCLPVWVMAIECPQVMRMAYLLNKECEIDLLIEQEMYNLLLENYAEYSLLSWTFTDGYQMACTQEIFTRSHHGHSSICSTVAPRFVSWHAPVCPNSTCVRRTRVKWGDCRIAFSDTGEH